MVCGGLWLIVVVCGSLWLIVVVCGSLWWFVVVCGGFSCGNVSKPPIVVVVIVRGWL